MDDKDVQPLIERMDYLVNRVSIDFHRYLFEEIKWENRLIGIKGGRGTGKTTLLRQHVRESFGGVGEKVLYVSLDDLWFSRNSLIDLADWHRKRGGTHMFIDEVHYLKPWQTYIKNLTDFFPDLSVGYTGSSMLKIDYGGADISRRQIVYDLNGLSFREYLAFEGIKNIAPLGVDEILRSHREVAREITHGVSILKHFHDYLSSGYYPFYREDRESFHVRLQSVVNQVLEVDLPTIEEVSPATVFKAKKMLAILADSVPQTPKMAVLYRELETDRNQGLKILKALARSGLLGLLSTEKVSLKDMSRPDKIYLDNTNLISALSGRDANVGTVREVFAVNQLSQAHQVEYKKKNGDFFVDGRWTLEIGGADKGFGQIANIQDSYVLADDIETPNGAKIPLWLLGFLY